MQILNNIMALFMNNAYAVAPGTGAPQGGGGYSLLIMTAIFVLFMYFVMWRPQSKRAKEHRDLLNSLAKGDEVVTAGGILGKVVKITDQYMVLGLTDLVEITIQKSSIVTVLPKGTLKSI
jgi:preprotein translocase subunit YajC